MKLLISKRAKAKLQELIGSITEFHATVCVGRVKGGVARHVGNSGETVLSPIESGWGVGFYDSSKLAPDEMVSISGMDFIIDETLNGKTLVYENERFAIKESSRNKGVVVN